MSRRLGLVVGAALLAALVASRAAADVYVDALWFRHLGYEGVFARAFVARAVVFAVGTLLAAAFCFLNLTGLFRLVPSRQVRRRRYGDLEFAEAIPARYWIGGAAAVSALFGAWCGRFLAARTDVWLAARYAVPWGVVDPLFGRDLGFYVFHLPAHVALHAFATLVLLGTAVLSVVAHVVGGHLRIADGRIEWRSPVRTHLAVLLGFTFLLVAWGYWIGLYGMLNSGRGPTDAIGYTDVAVRVPGHRAMVAVAFAAAVAAFVSAWRRTMVPLVAAGGVFLAGVAVADHVIPAAVQKLRVDPNELALERATIAWNLAFTRRAYGLDDVARAAYPYRPDRTPDPRAVRAAVAGLPLWDERSLKLVFDQFEGLATYYAFPDVDLDRYGTGAAAELVAVAVREVDTSRVAPAALTWQNLHASRTYAHGIGLVMSSASRAGPTGEPIYFVSGLPPQVSEDAPPDVRLLWPEVYFGEASTAYVLWRPESGADAEGPEPLGVELGSWFRRLALAWAFQDKNLLLSRAARDGSRILYHRRVADRLRRLFPYLRYELEPGAGPEAYPVLADGRIVWVVEAYTASRHFPLAQRGPGGVRYLRNSVKATVDALTGAVRFYVTDPADPVVRVLGRAFPGALRPLDEMPDAIRVHLRYPAAWLRVQGELLRAYHVPGPDSLYHGVDMWDVAKELYPGEEERPAEPARMLWPDGRGGRELVTFLPFTPRGRDNLRAFLVARPDPDARPRLFLYVLPAEQILGPRQVEALIRQDPFISQQLNLWAQRGVAVTRGHLLVLPVDSTFLYVKPLYLAAQGSGAVPGLRRVIVAHGTRLAMGADLEGALAALEEGRPVPAPELAAGADLGWPPPAPAVADTLRALIERADSALRRGDLRTFSDLWDEIRRLARRGARAGEPR